MTEFNHVYNRASNDLRMTAPRPGSAVLSRSGKTSEEKVRPPYLP